MEHESPRTIRALIQSARVTDATRKVLLERLDADVAHRAPCYFNADDYATLMAICRVLAPSGAVPDGFVASEIDQRLSKRTGNGWRYANLPPDGEAFKVFLRGLDELARRRGVNRFARLRVHRQRALFSAIERGGEIASGWHAFDLERFLEELLTECAELFYCHPLAQQEIGYIGFADAGGWKAVGLNQPDPLESRSHRKQGSGHPTETSDPHPSMRRYSTGEVVDAVVIGTGAGGAPLLARLARAGLKVVALEAGDFFDFRKFPTDERAQNKLFWLDERLCAGEDPIPFGNNNSGCGVGGSTLHYTAYVPRPHGDDFQVRSRLGVGSDWCLSYDDLEPYFDELEWFLGVSGPTPYPWGKPRRRGYPLPPHPLNSAAKLMQRGCGALGIRTSPAANASVSHDYFQTDIGWRARCTNRGFCQAGCSIGAKGSMDVTYLPLAIKHGAEVRARSFVTGFEKDARGRISAVVYTRGDQTERQRCRHVFLCAGTVESARLLLMNDLANSSGQVGRNFMAHMGVQVWGVFDETTYPHKGIPAGLISEDTRRPAERLGADFASGYLLQSIGVMPITYVSQLARSQRAWGGRLDEWMMAYNHTAGINVHGECLPYAHNRVELSDEKDQRGLPKPLVRFSRGENERKMASHAQGLMRDIWAAAGARKLWAFDRSAHCLGTCRMGSTPSDAVVDAECRSFDVPNLYICDASVFPSSLTVNPALTIMALSLRTADRFLEQS